VTFSISFLYWKKYIFSPLISRALFSMNCLGYYIKGAPGRTKLKTDKDEDKELRLLASVVATNYKDNVKLHYRNDSSQPFNDIKATPRLLETRILIAMYKIRSAIEEIEAARIAGPTRDEQQHNLITAVCSLESAMDNMDGASRCLQSEDGSMLQDLDDEELEFSRLLCCLHDYEDELDALTVATEDSNSIRENETSRILDELKAEEATLGQLMNMAVSIRKQQEAEEGDIVSSAPVVISASDSEGKHQCLSTEASACRLCGRHHSKSTCPSFQSSHEDLNDASTKVTFPPPFTTRVEI
jgi:hypothetical protein